jgi:hypothetical protein
LQPQEPDFLDLNAPRAESKHSPDSNETPASGLTATRPPDIEERTKVSGLSATRPPDVSTYQAKRADPDEASEYSSSVPRPSVIVQKVRQAGKAIVSAVEEDERTKFDSLKTKATSVRHLAASSLPSVNGISKRGQDGVDFHEGAGDDVLPHVDEREAQPPEVTYRHGESYLIIELGEAHCV